MSTTVTTISAELVFLDGSRGPDGKFMKWGDLDEALLHSANDVIQATLPDDPVEATKAVTGLGPHHVPGTPVAWRVGDHWVVDRSALAHLVGLASASRLSESDEAWLLVQRSISRGSVDVATIEVVNSLLQLGLSIPERSLLMSGRVRPDMQPGDAGLRWLAEHGSGGSLHQLSSTETLGEAVHLVELAIDAARATLIAKLRRSGEPISLLVPLVEKWERHIDIWATQRQIDDAGEEKTALAKRDRSRQLLARDVAMRLGIKPESLRRQVRRGSFPSPDGRIGRVPWWSNETLAAWATERRRPAGARGPS